MWILTKADGGTLALHTGTISRLVFAPESNATFAILGNGDCIRLCDTDKVGEIVKAAALHLPTVDLITADTATSV